MIQSLDKTSLARLKKSGRKRATIALGTVLGFSMLSTTAAFTDYGLLNVGGAGGFGGSANIYDLKFSASQEDTVAAVPAANWIDAHTATDVVPIEGADALIPGGAPIYVNLPVRNASPKFASELNISFLDLKETPGTADAAYAKLLRIDIAEVADATTPPATFPITNLALTAGAIAPTTLTTLQPEAGNVILLKIYLLDTFEDATANSANGGTVVLQARFDGTSTAATAVTP